MYWYKVTLHKGDKFAIVALLGESVEDAISTARREFGCHLRVEVEPLPQNTIVQIGGNLVAVSTV